MSLRKVLVLIHCYVGLAMAGFLVVAGLSGSLLVWYDELDAWTAPALYRAEPPASGAVPLDPLVLRELVSLRFPGVLTSYVPLGREPGRSVRMVVRPMPGQVSGHAIDLPYDEIFVNPYTGDVLGGRRWGDITEGLKNLMPFIYRLHDSLALGEVGRYAFGIVALLWTLDCFVGAYLTFPAPQRKTVPRLAAARIGKPWLARWWPSWKVRWGGGSYKVNFDLHRAGGLWVWAMLFVIAWSSVAFNLTEVYNPVMRALFAHQHVEEATPVPVASRREPGMTWTDARTLGRRFMADQARQHGFRVLAEHALRYEPATATFSYRVRSSLDVAERWGVTAVRFDANTGVLREVWLPTGAASGDTIRTWITSLHMAAPWGVPYRSFVCLLGLVVAMLSVTGVTIWWKKRCARSLSRGRNSRSGASLGNGA